MRREMTSLNIHHEWLERGEDRGSGFADDRLQARVYLGVKGRIDTHEAPAKNRAMQVIEGHRGLPFAGECEGEYESDFDYEWDQN